MRGRAPGRESRCSLVVVLICSLVFAPTLAGQATVPDYLVRVTMRGSRGAQRVTGHLIAVTADSLTLRVDEGDFVATIDRHTIVHIEKQRGVVSIGRAAAIGCLFLGGVFALIGSQAHDPDSPGIENAFAIWGFGIGCLFGAGGGILLRLLSARYDWEEITL